MPEESSYFPTSMNETSPSFNKWARPVSNIAIELEKLVKSFDKMMKKSYEEMHLLIDVLKKKGKNVIYDFV